MIISAVTDIYLVRTLHDLARQWWPDIHPMVMMAASWQDTKGLRRCWSYLRFVSVQILLYSYSALEHCPHCKSMLKFWIFTARLIQAAEICRVGLTTIMDTLQVKSDQKMTIPPVVGLCFIMVSRDQIRKLSCQVMRLNISLDIRWYWCRLGVAVWSQPSRSTRLGPRLRPGPSHADSVVNCDIKTLLAILQFENIYNVVHILLLQIQISKPYRYPITDKIFSCFSLFPFYGSSIAYSCQDLGWVSILLPRVSCVFTRRQLRP